MATKRRTFDLETEARRLYQTAKAKADFTGAASVLRLLRDLRPAGSGRPVADNSWLDWQTADERNQLDAAFTSINALKRLAIARRDLGGEPPASYLVGGDEQFWRDTPETLEERRARPIASASAAPTTDEAPAESSFVLEQDEIEIELEEGEVLPGDPP